MFPSKSKQNQDIIFLTGYEVIKVILMKENYKSYDVLYQFNEENSNILQIVELFFEKILLCLNNFN